MGCILNDKFIFLVLITYIGSLSCSGLAFSDNVSAASYDQSMLPISSSELLTDLQEGMFVLCNKRNKQAVFKIPITLAIIALLSAVCASATQAAVEDPGPGSATGLKYVLAS